MKRLLALFCITILLQGCTALTALTGSQTGPWHVAEEIRSEPIETLIHSGPAQGTTVTTTNGHTPTVVVGTDGGHSIVMPPCGNTTVVVHPDGSHSIAIVSGSSAIIVTN